MERTLTALRRGLTGDIYVYLRDAQIGERFLRDAEKEGFALGTDRPSAHPYALIMALHDGDICYVGANGSIRFGCGDAKDFHRIDYALYVSGATDFRYLDDHVS